MVSAPGSGPGGRWFESTRPDFNVMKVSIIGLGYVGITTAAGLSEIGHEVIGYDIDKDRVKLLQDGKSPIYEPGLDELLRKNISEKRLTFTTSPEKAITHGDIIFICTGTPSREDGSADLTQVEGAAKTVARYINGFKLIVEKSTVPVKTAQWIERTMKLYLKKHIDFEVASNPEFLKEGDAINDFLKPDRIVIGVNSKRAEKMLRRLYKPIRSPIVVTDINTAEIIKHASNAFLAMKISFINMISDLCEATGADIELVAKAMGMDKRIGKQFLRAGVGYGGSCFPKDVKALYWVGKQYGLNFELLKNVHEINESRIDVLMKHLKNALWNLKDKSIAIWGLSFKPNTDDIREAPSIKVIKRILREGGRVTLYDPKAMENMRKIFPEGEAVKYAKDKYEAVKDAEALVILTEWDEFKDADLDKVKNAMLTPIIVDGRNIYRPRKVKRLGFEYYPMGRPS